MNPTPVKHRRPQFSQVFTLLLVTGLFMACRTADSPPTTSPPTTNMVQPPSATAVQPAAPASPRPTAQDDAVQTNPTAASTLQVELPPEWRVAWRANHAPPTAAVALLRDPAHQLWALRLNAPATDAPAVHLLATTTPRTGLTLTQYLAGFSAQLEATPDLAVQRAGIIYDLRPDRRPVAVIQYSRIPASADVTWTGYQVVQYDETAENLIQLTFVTAGPWQPGLLENIHAIAATAQVTVTNETVP